MGTPILGDTKWIITPKFVSTPALLSTWQLRSPHPQCLCKPQALDMAMGRNALSLGCGLHLAGNF